jgi:hypothetical protein
VFRLARGPLDWRSRPRKISDSHDPESGRLNPLTHLLTDKAFNATTFTYVATAPPAWEQYPYLILLFLPIPGWAVRKLPLYTPCRALFYRRCLLDAQNDNHHARIFWGLALSVPRRPPQLHPDPASTATGQQRNNVRTSTTGDRMLTGPRAFHRPITDVITTPQG